MTHRPPRPRAKGATHDRYRCTPHSDDVPIDHAGHHRRAQRRIAVADEAIFELSDLSVYYGTFRAVRNVDMTINKHKITAFIGPSGCGKTTVLRCFNRMNDLIRGARVEGIARVPGRRPLWPRRVAGRGAPPHRHGLPEAKSVSQVHLRQHRRTDPSSTASRRSQNSTTSSSARSRARRCGTRSRTA